MKIAVNSAAGFIGSHLAEALTHQGHAVAGIDNFTNYYAVQLKQANADYVRNNIVAIDRLVLACQRQDSLHCFTNVSTLSVYGRHAYDPEDAAPKPASYYSVTKLAEGLKAEVDWYVNRIFAAGLHNA